MSVQRESNFVFTWVQFQRLTASPVPHRIPIDLHLGCGIGLSIHADFEHHRGYFLIEIDEPIGAVGDEQRGATLMGAQRRILLREQQMAIILGCLTLMVRRDALCLRGRYFLCGT